jgi:Fe-S oxidoreductase
VKPAVPATDAVLDRVVLHGHCHQKALWARGNFRAVPASDIRRRNLTTLDTGCCGMAGSFGYADEAIRALDGDRRGATFPCRARGVRRPSSARPARAAATRSTTAPPARRCTRSISPRARSGYVGAPTEELCC